MFVRFARNETVDNIMQWRYKSKNLPIWTLDEMEPVVLQESDAGYQEYKLPYAFRFVGN